MEVMAATPSASARENEHGDVADASYTPMYRELNFSDVAHDMELLVRSAVERYSMLKDIAAALGASDPTPAAASHSARSAEKKHSFNVSAKGPERYERAARDEVSHFLLCMALCRSFERRNVLLEAETALFASRVEGADAAQMVATARQCAETPIEPLGAAEHRALEKELDMVARGPRHNAIPTNVPHYKVPFEAIPAPVAARRVLVWEGAAYLPQPYLIDVLAAGFRASLSRRLAIFIQNVGFVEADARYRDVLEEIRRRVNAHSQPARASVAAHDSDLRLAEVPGALPAMPLCMQHLMAGLQQAHHLRHTGRMQLGLFLKSCGLTMEESLQFWRDEFGRGNITAEQFQKRYAYNIRHVYGQEGRRQELSCFGCMKIINDRPGPGEHHGCPFREFNRERLGAALRKAGVRPADTPSIVAAAEDGNYQAACAATLQASQPPPPPPTAASAEPPVITHPSEYFDHARERRRAAAAAAAAAPRAAESAEENTP